MYRKVLTSVAALSATYATLGLVLAAVAVVGVLRNPDDEFAVTELGGALVHTVKFGAPAWGLYYLARKYL